MQNIKNFTLLQLRQYAESINQSSFRAEQVFSWLCKGVTSFEQMTNLPKNLQELLSKYFYISTPSVYGKYVSKDGTIKYLWKLRDGELIESVLMEYKHGVSICVSTQVGCNMGCRFCASGLGGKVRNLDAGEIIDQIIFSQLDTGRRISNVVLMGMGEPLDNFDSVVTFLRNVGNSKGLGISYRHISLSTCGVVPKIYELADLGFPVTLSVSLHAADNSVREGIMPVSKKYTVYQLLQACRYFIGKTNRRISFEYILISGVNDSVRDAMLLAALCKDMLCHVNLIPANPVDESGFKRSTAADIKKFKSSLESKGVNVTVRRELGSDISASCGQLRKRCKYGV